MITVSNLTKWYGDHLAVEDLSFEIGEGHVYGFLGPNGAGKSTTMNIMTGCLSATSGQVLIDGHDIFEEPEEAKRQIGYLPEQPPLYMSESPREYLRFVGEAKGLRGAELESQIDAVIRQTGIQDVAHRRISALSKGYKQRVGIAQALMGDPKVIILDEPTVGLDPLQIIEIRDLIRELGKSHTVIFSSHILSEVQTICDEILMIAHGRLVAFDTPEALEKALLTPNELLLTTDVESKAVQDILADIPEVSQIHISSLPGGRISVQVRTGSGDLYETARAVFRGFAKKGLDLLELRLQKADLEDVFIELSEGSEKTKESEADEP